MTGIATQTPFYMGPIPYGISGLVPQYASTTTLTVSAGWCMDSTNLNQIILTGSTGNYTGIDNVSNNSPYVVNGVVTINAANVGINGLDTGSLAASTVYAVYAIDNTMNNPLYPAGVILSKSLTAPALPTGYDVYRLVGYVSTNSSSQFNIFYTQAAGNYRKVNYDSLISVLSAGTATSFTAVSCAAAVPAIANLDVQLKLGYTPATAANKASIRVGGGTGTTPLDITGAVATVLQDEFVSVFTGIESSNASFDYKVASASDSLSAWVWSYSYSV